MQGMNDEKHGLALLPQTHDSVVKESFADVGVDST